MKPHEMLSVAIQIATAAHDGQFDRGNRPYILHVLKVMHYCKSDDDEINCIAVLHDVLEDTSVTEHMLYYRGMSDRVVEGVKALTKLKEGETYEEYKAKVKSNPDARYVKKRDLRHNSDIRRLKGKTITQKDIDRTIKYQQFYLELEAMGDG